VAELPKALRNCWGRAEGNPFYMEELVKMLMDNRDPTERRRLAC
jgi:hypothetical protein